MPTPTQRAIMAMDRPFFDQLMRRGSHPNYPVGTPVYSIPLEQAYRPDGTLKGSGFFGALLRPDNTGVMSEYSVADSEQLRGPHGEWLDYPTLVPTLTADEIAQILTTQEGKRLSPEIYNKAEAFALARKRAGLPLFAQPSEENIQQFPQFKRAIAIPVRSPLNGH